LKDYFDPKEKLELLFMGCVDHVHKDFYNPKELVRQYKEVVGWRDNFLERIFKAEKRIELKKTGIYARRRTETLEKLEKATKELQYLKDPKVDESSPEYKQRLQDNKENMTFIFNNKLLLLEKDKAQDDPNVDVDKFWGIIQEIRKSNLPKPRKIELVSPWNVAD